jgi:hypothetical protein
MSPRVSLRHNPSLLSFFLSIALSLSVLPRCLRGRVFALLAFSVFWLAIR